MTESCSYVIFGSTGKHYAQIVHGAPFEVFLAADTERPERLERSGHAVAGTRFTYALGRLALWSADPERVVDGAALLERGDFRRLAIANPALAPYGRAARETLEARGAWQAAEPRLVTAENVAQAYQFVASGNAEVGLVAGPLLLQDEAGPRGSWWLVPETLHAPIAQQALLLREHPGGRAFLAYLPNLKTVILVGMCGGIDEVLKEGDFIIPSAAIRGEGTSNHYLPKGFPAIPASSVNLYCIGAVRQSGRLPRCGIIYTTDRRLWEFDDTFVDYLRNQRILGIDMELATLFSVAYRYAVPIGSIMLISDMHRAIGQDLFQVPQFSKWAKAVADVMLFDM